MSDPKSIYETTAQYQARLARESDAVATDHDEPKTPVKKASRRLRGETTKR